MAATHRSARAAQRQARSRLESERRIQGPCPRRDPGISRTAVLFTWEEAARVTSVSQMVVLFRAYVLLLAKTPGLPEQRLCPVPAQRGPTLLCALSVSTAMQR